MKGYHDIMTVLFLTLPEEQQLSCAEQLSLHRLRDSMGKGLEPLIGLLRCVVTHPLLALGDITRSQSYGSITKYLFRLVDPSFASLIET